MARNIALDWILGNEDRLIEVADAIWRFAEIGLQEFKSSALLADELEQGGFDLERGVADMPTAFVASYGSGKPVLGIMGEYDALPGLSQKTVPHREPEHEGAPGHGCGHNIHGSSGTGAALAVKQAMEKKRIRGTVKFFGCPAEETLVGKVIMVRDGVFHGVDALLSHHPSAFNVARMGSTNAMNSVKFHFYGRAAHAAGSPMDGRGAIDAVELMNVAANYMREHIVQEARIHYVIEEGGHEPNVIPPHARSWYYVRAPERDQVEHIYKWVLDLAAGADLMAQTNHEVEFLTGCYNMIPNRCLCELVTGNMHALGAPSYSEDELVWARKLNSSITPEQKRNWLRQSKRPGWEELINTLLDASIPDSWDEGDTSPASTDVGDVSWNAPTLEFSTTAGVLGIPGHSWQFTAQSGISIGHKSMLFAARTMAISILDLFTSPELLQKALEEFLERRGCREYRSPLPPDLKPPVHQLKS